MGHYDNDHLGETPYRFALDIYDLFSFNGQHYDPFLWFQDTQLVSSCLNRRDLFNDNLPINLSRKDRAHFLFLTKTHGDDRSFNEQFDFQNVSIVEYIPELKDSTEELFNKNPYIINEGENRIINHEQAINFVEFMVNVKEGIYPLVIEEIDEKGKKADKEFLSDALKFFEAEELFVRSAILISSICHIFNDNEKDKERWINVFNRNNKFYFCNNAKKYDAIYQSIKALFNNCINGHKLDKITLETNFKSLIAIRRNAYEKYLGLWRKIYSEQVD